MNQRTDIEEFEAFVAECRRLDPAIPLEWALFGAMFGKRPKQVSWAFREMKKTKRDESLLNHPIVLELNRSRRAP